MLKACHPPSLGPQGAGCGGIPTPQLLRLAPVLLQLLLASEPGGPFWPTPISAPTPAPTPCFPAPTLAHQAFFLSKSSQMLSPVI